MNFKRSERVSELLRHEISSYVQTLNAPGLGFVTITGVHVSDDLSDAKAYFSVFGSEEERARTTEILNEAVPEMRRVLGRKLESLYRFPTLAFVYDDSPARAQRVFDILNRLHREEAAQAEAPAPEAPRKRAAPKKNAVRRPRR